MSSTMTSPCPTVEPPSYIDPPEFVLDGELPDYHRNAAADERIMLAQPQAPRPSTRVHSDYIFKSERLELNLGEKKWPVKVPAYGWKDTVKGTVLVKDFKAVNKITVTLEGACHTSVMERGMAMYSASKPLLSKFKVLWTKSENSSTPEEPKELSFSFPFPVNAVGTNIRLPHSYATVHATLSADVTYHFRVDVFKKGLRRHERLRTMILYLPRSTPPETTPSSLDVPQWESIPITPKYSLRRSRASEDTGSTKCPSSVLNSRKIYRGTLQSFREGGETSWNLPEFLEIKYTLRVRIRAPGLLAQDPSAFPQYFVDYPISMCTHNHIPNADDMSDPVIGLIAVAGSQGAPTNAPLTHALQI
ncbi:hypothetical protein M408DRAFT_327612 [Serendipita vermifera MAFF 305830]|uniref:Uncharacterized protein n=1 Tax=Serendipita vermifera MAFF 305830 TaxID=933852 RepID=A0A0C3BGT9_SERVB|nr:hypothetical protein M408DRAFT_327612 [Serendipita vermifera MAFF 305830]